MFSAARNIACANLIFTAYSNCHDNTAICLAKITVYLILESKLFQSSYGNSGFQLTILSCLSLSFSCVFELFFPSAKSLLPQCYHYSTAAGTIDSLLGSMKIVQKKVVTTPDDISVSDDSHVTPEPGDSLSSG